MLAWLRERFGAPALPPPIPISKIETLTVKSGDVLVVKTSPLSAEQADVVANSLSKCFPKGVKFLFINKDWSISRLRATAKGRALVAKSKRSKRRAR